MISIAHFILHVYFGVIAGGIAGYTVSTWGEWFPQEEQERPAVTSPLVIAPLTEEESSGIAPRLEREGDYE